MGINDRLYTVQVPAQSTLVITLRDLAADVDYDLYLYDAASVEVGRSTVPSNAPEQIEVPVTGGRYTVRVHFFQGLPNVRHDVRWQWLPRAGG